MPELGYLKNVHVSVLESLQSGITLLLQKKFDDSFKEYKKVVGALNLARFDGVARVVEDMVDAVQKMSADVSMVTPANNDLMVKLTQEVKQYVLDMLSDAPDVPMKLYENYRALRTMKKQGSHPSQLFFPDLSFAKWQSQESTGLDSSSEREAAWQQESAAALALWMKSPVENKHELEVARKIFVEIAKTKLTSQMLGFITASIASIEVLSAKPGADGFDRVVLSRVDNEIKNWFNSRKKPSEDSLRYLLYLIGVSDVKTPVIESVLEQYKIKQHIEDIRSESHRKGKTLDEQTLQPVKEALAHVKEAWSRLNQGIGTAQDMEKPATMLSERLPVFDHPAIKRLGDGLLQLTLGVRTGRVPLNELLAEEMASLLLLLDQAIEARGRVSMKFEDNAIIQIKRTLAAVKNDTAALSALPMPEIDKEAKARNKKILKNQVLLEVKSQLAVAEEALDQWIRGDGNEQREEVVAAIRPLRRLGPVLLMAQQPNASAALGKIMVGLETIFGKAKHLVAQEEYESLSQQMAALSLYIEAEMSEQSNSLRFFGKANDEDAKIAVKTQKRQEPIGTTVHVRIADKPVVQETKVAVKVEEPKKVEVVISGNTDEIEKGSVMLDIYLEDFDEQLKTMKDGSLVLARNPRSKEALSDVRRGFHTLKGSGRMISGMVRLPNVAERIELFLKRLLAEEKGLTPPLLEAIDEAINAFEVWRDELKNSSKATVEHQNWMDKFEYDADTNAAAHTAVKPAITTPVAVPATIAEIKEVKLAVAPEEKPLSVEKEVVAIIAEPIISIAAEKPAPAKPNNSKVYIGSIVVERELYEAFLEEAAVHMSDIIQAIEEVANESEKGVTKRFMRAAHTLGSTSKTVGFTELAELGYLLERWSENQMGTGSWIGQEEWSALTSAVNHAKDIYNKIEAKEKIVLNKDIVRHLENFMQTRNSPNARRMLELPAAIDKDAILKMRTILERQKVALRQQLGEIESMLMMLETE
jgi:chemosensory pili system protein ChpA (sensor histidine kinase/response regulator)